MTDANAAQGPITPEELHRLLEATCDDLIEIHEAVAKKLDAVVGDISVISTAVAKLAGAAIEGPEE